MKYKAFEIYFFLIFILIASCEMPINWQLNNNTDDEYVIVVESIITNEYKNQLVKISKPVSELNSLQEMVSGANVTVLTDEKTYVFVEDSLQKGYYYSAEKFGAKENNSYLLNITYNGVTYSATDICVSVNNFEVVSYDFDESKQLYYLTNIPNQFSGNENAMYQITIDMSNIAGYDSLPYDSSHIVMYYYTMQSIDVPEVLPPEKEKIFFPQGSEIRQKKYSLSPEHADFVRSLLLETTWSGGAFDVEQGNVISNLNNGALGFFGVCSVIEKKITVE